MKATFFYDVKFLKENEKIYSHYGINNELADRYLEIFEDFEYVGREEDKNESNKKYIDPKYEITKFKVRTYKSNYSNIFKIVKEEVKKAEFCIIRLPAVIGLIVQRECEKQKKPYIVEVVGNIFEALWYNNFKAKLLAFPFHIITKHAIKNSKCVAYITQTYLQKCYPTKYNSFSGVANVSIETFEQSTIDKRLNKIDIMNETDIINIGLIGSLDVKYKGQDTAIKAIKIVKDQFPNIYLNLVGHGSKNRWEKMCEKYHVSDKVKFCGSLPGGEPVLNWMDNMDIYIQPSLTEGHGRSVVEAMSRACAVFASDTGGLIDSVDKEYRFQKKSEEQLANLIIKYMKDKNFAKEVSTRSFENSKKYSKDIVENNRQNAYNQSIKYWENRGSLNKENEVKNQ